VNGAQTKTAALRWTGEELVFEAEAGSGAGATIDSNEGPAGMGPMEMLLVSLAACTAMDVISILSKKRQPVAEYRVDARGEQHPDHPRTFTSIVIEHQVEGDGCRPEAVSRSIELSATRYCPVTAHISAGETEIHHGYVLRENGHEHRAEVVVTGPRGAGLARRVAAGPDS
jgi:putative redox protein